MSNPRASAQVGGMQQASDGRERGKTSGEEEMAEHDSVEDMRVERSCNAGGRKRYADIAAAAHTRDKRAFARDEVAYSEKEMREMMAHVCQETTSCYAKGRAVECNLPSAVVYDSFAVASRRGVCMFFMGKPLKSWMLKEWAATVLGPDIIEHFVFLGKGLYFAQCVSEDHAHNLIQRALVGGSGTNACIMPWNALFDPMQDVLRYCPVWVSITNFPVYLRHQMHGIVSCLGKVLFVPKNDAVISTTVRVCILWDMAKRIPGYIEWKIGLAHPLCFPLSFSSFPNACYKCKSIGHFAKSCPVKGEFHVSCMTLDDKENAVVKADGKSVTETLAEGQDAPQKSVQKDAEMREEETESPSDDESDGENMCEEDEESAEEEAKHHDNTTSRSGVAEESGLKGSKAIEHKDMRREEISCNPGNGERKVSSPNNEAHSATEGRSNS